MAALFCVVEVSVSGLLGLYPIVSHQLWLKDILSSDIVQCPPQGTKSFQSPSKVQGPQPHLPHLGLDIPRWHELVVKSMVSPPKGRKYPHPMVWISLESMAAKRIQR